MLLLYIVIILLNLSIIGSINHYKAEEYDNAMMFLDQWLNPSNCTNQRYAIVEMGIDNKYNII